MAAPHKLATKTETLAGSGTVPGWPGVSDKPPASFGQGEDGVSWKLPISCQTGNGHAVVGLPISRQADVHGFPDRPSASPQSSEKGVSGEQTISLGNEAIRELNRESTLFAPSESGGLIVLLISFGAGADDPNNLLPATKPPAPTAASPATTQTTSGNFAACEATPFTTAR